MKSSTPPPREESWGPSQGPAPALLQPASSPPTSSSRILYDIPCKVCRDHSSGKHYGIFACDGCAGFFKRSIRRSRQYSCKSKRGSTCLVDKAHRNQCRACRLAKCLDAGMNKDGPCLPLKLLNDTGGIEPPPPRPLWPAVQHERGPRNATLRRQMGLLMKSSAPLSAPLSVALASPLAVAPPPLLDATLSAEEAASEAAARLLFMNVRWAQQVAAFSALPFPDRIVLLVESWRALFVLGAGALGGLGARAGPLWAAVEGVARARPDQHELACLRAAALFSPAATPRLHDARAVHALHDHAHLVLGKYVAMTHPDKPLRFTDLLMLLPTLKMVPPSAIEEQFFRKTIGNIPIERIISDMYRTSESDVLYPGGSSSEQ